MKTHRFAMIAVLATGLAMPLTGCGYNTIQTQDEDVKAKWSQVVNEYKRRADLIPNLVKTVQGYAAQEKEVLVGVTEARARATSIQLSPEMLNDPAAIAKFEGAQTQLGQSLGRLLAVSENYPQLKSDQNFRDLQVQLESTENRITVERGRFIAALQTYNTTVRKFPVNLTAKMFGYEAKPNFTVANETQIAEPPSVDFSKK
jgi:LemA protein